ncbi:MAG: C4-type zinc ribbon domain-containing protein [Eubacteriales bacterium]
MDQLAKLYEYQQIELELEERELKFKETDTRKKLLVRQKYFQNANNVIKRIEKDILVRQNTIAEVENATLKLVSEKQELDKKLDNLSNDTGGKSIDDIKGMLHEHEAVMDMISKNKRLVLEAKKASEKADEELKNILPQMSKVKKEFNELKLIYLKEMEDGSPEITELKKKADKVAKGIDASIMKKYNLIKRTVKDPVAFIIEGNKCSGCNMQLPSGNLGSMKNSSKIFECDNCGRILIVK